MAPTAWPFMTLQIPSSESLASGNEFRTPYRQRTELTVLLRPRDAPVALIMSLRHQFGIFISPSGYAVPRRAFKD
jgi:hypothetical protein